MNECKIIIAGGRNFFDYGLVCDSYKELINSFIVEYDKISIVSGCALGADQLGIRLAQIYGLGLYEFPANWEKYGRKAGPIRNTEMGEFADMALIFWDGESKGTKHMISVMHRLNKPYTVINY